MRKIYIMLLMSSVVLLTACDMLDIQPTGKVIPQTLAEYRALIATAYKNVPDARGLACFRSDELYVKDDSWEQDRYGKIECWDDFSARDRLLPLNGRISIASCSPQTIP